MNDNVNSVVRWAVIENIVTLLLFAAIVIFAPGGWKGCGVALLLNLNYFKTRKADTPNATEQARCKASPAFAGSPLDSGR